MANQPSLIPSAWAANNSTTETIPATTTESGKASWDQGFPVETSLPLSQGGIPPKYGDFNGVLNVLSQFCLFAQAGGQFTWSSTLAYSVGSIVVGSDGSIYRAVQATTNVNPVGDTSGKWERIVSKSDIDALEQDIQDAMDAASDAVSNASAAQSAVTTLDANVVKLSGAQMISGNKTFNDRIIAKTGDFIVCDVDDSYLRINGGTASTKGGSVLMYGKDSSICPGWVVVQANDGTNSTNLDITPTGALMWGGKGFVYDSGDQTISGTKTFSNTIKSNNNTTVARNVTDQEIQLCGGTSITTGGSFLAWGKDKSQAGYSGAFMCRATLDGTTRRDLWGKVDGTLTWNGQTIQTSSDERLKTAFSVVPDAILDAWGTVAWQQFKFKDAVAKKGEENCRWHTGLVAQHVQHTFETEGQDVLAYGILCHDEWQDEYETDDEGKKVLTRHAGDTWTVRYEEALCMEAAYQRRRAGRAEARITALEQRLGELEAVLASLISPISEEQKAEPEQEGERADA